MAFSLYAFFESRAGTTSLTPVTPLQDNQLMISGDGMGVPAQYTQLIAAFASMSNATDTLVAARLQSPSMNASLLFDLPLLNIPAAGGNNEPANPPPINSIIGRPINLVAGEYLNFLEKSDGTTAANLCLGLVWLGDGDYTNPYGSNIKTVSATISATCVANTWTNGTLIFDQALPAGTYAVVGLRVASATLLAARLVFSNSGARPGCLGCDTLQDVGHAMFRHGNTGVWGTFTHSVPPQIQLLAVSTDSAFQCMVDVIQVA